jgi:tetratricopeptide (TPR) repeat protein
MKAGQYENALQVYGQHADRLLAEDSEKVLEHLHSIIGHVRENPASLEKLLDLFQKAGETTHVTEVLELLAHASVQSGELVRARDLYRKLAAMEPANPLHMSNYQQVVSQLGGTSTKKLITAEEAAVIVDELEATVPMIPQHYSDEVALAVRAALTDAELFISYNMPAKALGPLMAALPQAPQDLRLNQRLAALHTRASRFAEAGVCCRTLQSIYSEAGYPDEATRYRELADRYEERSASDVAGPAEVIPMEALSAEDVAEVSVEVAGEEVAEEAATSAPWPAAQPKPADEEPEFAIVGNESAQDAPVAELQDASAGDSASEWDDAITIELDTPTVAAEQGVITQENAQQDKVKHAKAEADPEKISETVAEVRFYLEHGMPEQAASAFEKLQTLTSDEATLEMLRGEIAAASQPAEEEATVEAVSEFASDTDSEVSEAEVAEEGPAEREFAVEVEAASDEPAVVQPEAVVEAYAAPGEHAQAVTEEYAIEQAQAEHAVAEEAVTEHAATGHAVETAAAPAGGVLQEFVSDLESSLGESFMGGAVAHKGQPTVEHAAAEAAAEEHQVEAAAEAAEIPQGEVIGEFVADLEALLGDDFLKGAPVPEPEPAPAQAAQVETPVAAQQWLAEVPAAAHTEAQANASPAVASAAAAAMGASSVVPVIPHAPKPPVPPLIPSAAPAAPKSSLFAQEAGIDLAEMFGELKQDLEEGTATSADEDPETHYNLGIAFREMGLLDEAIGELQKTCQAVDRGHPFPQVMQTYTWLAQCFLDKGVPQAAIRWYDKALTAPGVDEETRTALHYELASAYETAGDRSAALKHFMEVYGRNIDYRDVAERIKPLKS